jgi:hypothetical protein
VDTVENPPSPQLHPAAASFVSYFSDWVLLCCARVVAALEQEGQERNRDMYLFAVSRRNDALQTSSVKLPTTGIVMELSKLC